MGVKYYVKRENYMITKLKNTKKEESRDAHTESFTSLLDMKHGEDGGSWGVVSNRESH